MAPSLSDLRYLFYGGGSAAEYDFMLQAQAAGLTAGSLLLSKRIGYAEDVADRTAGTVPNAQLIVPAQSVPWKITFGGQMFNPTLLAGGILELKQDGIALVPAKVILHISSTANASSTQSRVVDMPAFAGADKTYTLVLSTLGGTEHLAGVNGQTTYILAERY